MDETEVEEGEACYYGDHSSVNPDIDLSYIDEKLQNVLGHFQKDFEGLVTTEGLGAKFGDYGSFLPTYQRHPSIFPHPNNPKNVQNLNSREAPKVLPVEGAPKDAAQTTRLGAAPRNVPSSNTSMATSAVITDKKGSKSLSTSQDNKSLVKDEPVLNKPVNSSDQRSLKVRIKLNSDKATKKKDALISSFGLNTTPSSSMGNSEDSSGMPPHRARTWDESPSHILQTMTSFPVPVASPLSPLTESLLSLEMKEKNSHTIIPVPSKKLSKDKHKRIVKKRENKLLLKEEIGDQMTTMEKAEVDVIVEDIESKIPGQASSFPNPLFGKVCDVVDEKKGADMALQVCKEAERNASRNREFSKVTTEEILGLVGDDSFESISDHDDEKFEDRNLQSTSIEKISESRAQKYCKDELVEVTRNVQSKKNESYSISKADSDGVGKSSSKGKKKSRRSQISADLASEAEGSLISGPSEVPKGKKFFGKIQNLKSHDDIKIHKALQPETKEVVTNHKYFSPEGPSLYKSKEISTQNDINVQLGTMILNEESVNNGDLSRNLGLASKVEPVPAEHVLIEENWAQCDRCDKWRLLPYEYNTDQLPDKWLCRMQTWLPGRNRCEFDEKEMIEVFRRLYQPVGQSNLINHGDRNVPVVLSVDGMHLGVDRINPSSNRVSNPQKFKTKATNNGGSDLISGSVKDFQQDVVKSRSLNSLKQKVLTEETNKHEKKNEKSGDSKEKKLKNKRAADQYEYETPKRTKVDAPGAVKITKRLPSSALQPGSSEMKLYDEREISLKKRKLKDWQESQNQKGESKDDGICISERKDFSNEEIRGNELRKVKKSAISSVEKMKIGKVMNLKTPVHEHKKGSEQFPKAATSSSSKVSDSVKSKSHFPEVRGSPVESVSSSPIRISNLKQLSSARRENSRKDDTDKGCISAKKSLKVEGNTEIKQSKMTKRLRISGVSNSESPKFSALDFRDNGNGQRSGGKSRVRDESKNLERPCPGDLQPRTRSNNDEKSNKNLDNDNATFQEKSRKGSSQLSKGKNENFGSYPDRINKMPTQSSDVLTNTKESSWNKVKTGPNHVANVETRDLKYRIKLVKDDRNDELGREAPRQDPVQGFNDGVETRSDLTRIEGSSSQVVSNFVAKKNPQAQIPRSHKGNVFDMVPADSSGSGDSLKVLSPLKNDASTQSNAALKKAEENKGYGDRLKDSGFIIESNEAYFQAVWYFLQAASLRESCNYDGNKHGEMSPMLIYSSTAKLSELCAIEYEKRNELAAAALAYKCVEVAYLRVVYCKNCTLARDRHDLQASLQIVPQGESPSSSASDVDSINNQVMVDKATLSKSIGGGNHIIAARNRPNFVRLLDFTKDVNSAMEASNKAQTTFDAAIKKGPQNSEGIVSVKRVIDLSFQDVDELLRLVRLAIDSISRQSFSGNKD